MASTFNYAGIGIVAAIVFLVFLFIAKRIWRLAVRLMLVGMLVIALLIAGVWGWWNGWFGPQATPRTERPAPTRRALSR